MIYYKSKHTGAQVDEAVSKILNDEIEVTPVVKGDAENSAVLKGGENKAISENAVALGSLNIAGTKAYKWSAINFDTKTITLVDTPSGISTGDRLSIINKNHYDDCCEVVSVSGKNIVVDSLPFTAILGDSGEDAQTIFVVSKPDVGNVDVGQCAFAEGCNTMATQMFSHAEGYGTKAIGKYSHTEGKQNEAHYCAHAEGSNNKSIGNTSHTEGTDNIASNSNAHAEGRYTTASGYASHAEGYGENVNNRTVASGDASHAEGRFTTASGKWSHAEGYGTIAKNDSEHAEGIYNVSNIGTPSNKTRHSVGIGTSDTDRKNAHEIMFNGKHYILGIGGYDGTNPANSKDIATYLPNMVNITYEKLCELRTNSNLVPGQQYRITDYTCTTTQEDTRSAGHQFDIIVTANSNNKLSEEARAIQHEGNSYFTDCNLSAWRIWYCLDNDTTRFAWADATDGKGVIYRMIDEWNNDVPYDFKNIQFKRYKITECAKCSTLVGKYTYREDSKYVIDKSRYIWAYTFTHLNDSKGVLDHSIVGAIMPNNNGFYVGVYNNKISSVSSYFYLGSDKPTQFQYRLNNICFISDGNISKGFSYGCYSNIFKSNCYSMTFGTSCNSNVFGEDCYENTFGDAIWFQTIGKECHNNIFGNGHKYNTLGDSSSNNIFGTNYKYNTLGYNCYNNEFGRDYFHNSFGNSNHGLKLGSYYSHNSFGNSNYELKFGDYLSSNVFLNNCSHIVFGSGNSDTAVTYSYYSNNFFGNNCWSLVLKETTTSSTNIQNYNFASGLQSKTIDLERGRSYETKVAKNSTGTLKIYCEADLIQ